MAEYGFEMRKLLELKYTEGNKGEVFKGLFLQLFCAVHIFYLVYILRVFGKPIFSFFVFIFTF